jgi:hypothetical protein
MRAFATFLVLVFFSVPSYSQQNSRPTVDDTVKSMRREMNSPEFKRSYQLAARRCNAIFEMSDGIQTATQFLGECRARRERKDCLQSSRDWASCVVEIQTPDPAIKP